MKSVDDIEYKSGLKKREIPLTDGSSTEACKLQVWNDDIKQVQFEHDMVATFRRLKVCPRINVKHTIESINRFFEFF